MKRILILVSALFFFGVLCAGGVYLYVKSTLPQMITLDDYKPLLVSNVYDREGKKFGEFFRERRILLPYEKIPPQLVNAFIAAEDDAFFQHSGVNFLAILRAAAANFKAGRTVQGGSTITQQVAKTLLLSSEKTLIRKAKEALLAFEMEEHLSKEDILYLYLNQIYFGQGAYGVAMAAETYFRKPVEELSIQEMALLAGLPKAPSAYSPVNNPLRAKQRQVYVLNRMADVGFIKREEAEQAAATPLKVFVREKYEEKAPYFLETIRLMLVENLSEEMVLDRGINIYTSLDLEKHKVAQEVLRNGLRDLDKRQGFRGPLGNITEPREVGEFLLKNRNLLIAEASDERIIQPDGSVEDYGPLDINYDLKTKKLPFYFPIGKIANAVVSKVDDNLGLVFVRSAEVEGVIDIETMEWARKPDPSKSFLYDKISKPSEALKMGDLIQVRLVSDRFEKTERYNKLLKEGKNIEEPNYEKYVTFELEQEPVAQAALISFDQRSQEVLSIVGGYEFKSSQYNRALQAARQTGSSFKALVYAAALDQGYTPATPIMDAPIVYEEVSSDEEGQEDVKVWKPTNHSKKFGGDILFRNALIKSLNVPTVKIIEDIGVPYSVDFARRLGIFSPLNPDYTLALGSSSVTLYEMTKVFAQFGRLGKRLRPIMIHKVESPAGENLLGTLSLDTRYAQEIETLDTEFEERRQNYLSIITDETVSTEEKEQLFSKKIEPHVFFENPDQLMKPTTAFLVTSLLRGVVEDRGGTGGRARALNREVAGKTGTTNGYYDAWFIGYTPQIATGVWVGHDQEKSLGRGEVGGRSALPIWLEYMKAAHENLPQMTFSVPDGIVFANIDSETGEIASATSKNIVRQAFLESTEPSSQGSTKEDDTDFYKQDLSE